MAIALINFSIESLPDDGVPFELIIAFLLGVEIWSLLVWLLSDYLSCGVESEELAKQFIPFN